VSAGRPTSLTEEVMDTIEDWMRDGHYPREACAAAGVSRRSFYAWKERGERELERIDALLSQSQEGEGGPEPGDLEVRESEAVYVEFLHRIARAEADAIDKALSCIRRAMEDRGKAEFIALADWRAAAEFLKRRRPEDWGDAQRTTVEHTGTVAIGDVGSMTAKEAQEAYRLKKEQA